MSYPTQNITPVIRVRRLAIYDRMDKYLNRTDIIDVAWMKFSNGGSLPVLLPCLIVYKNGDVVQLKFKRDASIDFSFHASITWQRSINDPYSAEDLHFGKKTYHCTSIGSYENILDRLPKLVTFGLHQFDRPKNTIKGIAK